VKLDSPQYVFLTKILRDNWAAGPRPPIYATLHGVVSCKGSLLKLLLSISTAFKCMDFHDYACFDGFLYAKLSMSRFIFDVNYFCKCNYRSCYFL